ncbi:hypothetical protein D9M68_919850 [compost metagenome]
MRRERSADIQVFMVKDLFQQRPAPGKHTGYHIAMPSKVFGGRLGNEVNAIGDGLLV